MSANANDQRSGRGGLRRWSRRLLKVIVALLLLGGLARLALPRILPPVLNSVAGMFGLEASYQEIHLRVLRADLELWGLQVGPQTAEGEVSPPILSIDYLGLDVDAGALLTGRLHIRRAQVDGLDLRIDRNEAGTWALLEVLAPYLEPGPADEAPPEPEEDSAPARLASPVAVSALRLNNSRVLFSDCLLDPPLERVLHFDVRLSDVGIADELTTIELQAWSSSLVDAVRVRGSARTGGEELSLDLEFELAGFEPKTLEVYLAALGVRPVATDIDMGGALHFLARRPDLEQDTVSLSLVLDGMRIEVDGQEEFAADTLQLSIPRLGGDGLVLEGLEVVGVRGHALRTEQGFLRLGGFELGGVAPVAGRVDSGGPPPAEEEAAQDRVGEPAEQGTFGLELATITGRELQFRIEDEAVSPPVELDLLLDEFQLSGLVIDSGRVAQRASFAAHGRVPGLIEAATFEGSARVDAASFDAAAVLRATQIRLGPLAPYLEGAGIESLYEGGEFSVELVAGGEIVDGVVRLGCGASDLRLVEREGDEPVFELGAAILRGIELDPGRAEYTFGEASLGGLRLRLERAEDGSFEVLGLRLGGSSQGEPATEQPPEVAASGDDRAPRAPSAPPTPGAPAGGAAESGAMPRIEITSVTWTDTRIEFIDHALESPLEQGFDDIEASLTGLVLGGTGEQPPAQIRLRASAGPLADLIDLSGEIASLAGGIDLRADIELEASGLSLVELQPYLAGQLFDLELEDGDLAMSLLASYRVAEDGFRFGLGLGEVSLRQGEELLASLSGLELEDLAFAQNELHVPRLIAAEPYLSVTLDKEGGLHFLGIRILPRVPEGGGPARLPRVHELVDLSQLKDWITSIAVGEGPVLRLDDLQLDRGRLAWIDQSISPSVHGELAVDAALHEFVIGREAPPATFELELSEESALGSLRVRGEAMPAPRHMLVRAAVEAEGLRIGEFAGYLPEGLEVILEDGRFAAKLHAEGEEYEPGEYRATVGLRDIDFREAGAERSFFALAQMGAELKRFSDNESVLELGDIVLKGLELELSREHDRVFQALGARVDLELLATAGAADEGTASEASFSATPADEGPDEDPDEERKGGAAPRKATLPRISLESLDLELARLTLQDRSRLDGRPLDLALWLSSSGPLVLLDANPEELDPIELHFGAALPPIVREVGLDFVIEPYVAEPRLHVEARAEGVSAAGLVEWLPELGDVIDGSQLVDGVLEGSAELLVRARRLGPTDYDLRSGFGFEFEASELALRETPGGEVSLGVGGVRVEARKIRPLTGDIHITEIEILEPRGSATRVEGGLRVGGVIVKLPEPTDPDAQAPVDADASEPAPETAAVDPLRSEPLRGPAEVLSAPVRRIDHFYITGMDFTLADESVEPAMYLPFSDVDLELRGLSRAALELGKPIRLNAFATAGLIRLPKRAANGALVELSDGEQSAWPGSSYAVEERPAFDEFTLNAELKTRPEPTGWAKLELRGLELLNYSGNSEEFGVRIEDGVLDSSTSIKLGGNGLTVDSLSTFTWLSMSEESGGPVGSVLSLPAPLDSVIFMTRNRGGENRIPVSFTVPTSGLSYSSIMATATATVAQVLASSIAQSPFRLVGGILDFTGLTPDTPVERVRESVEFEFEPGAPRARQEQREKLEALLEMLRKDDDLLLIVQHELGGGDIKRCGELANPDPEWCREFAVGLRLEKARLWKDRERIAERVRAEYAMGKIDRAESIADQLREVDAELGRTEDALDNIYQLLRPGAERRHEKRTKAACLELARLRLSVARATLLAELGPGFAARLEIRRPRYLAVEGDEGGVVVVTPKKKR